MIAKWKFRKSICQVNEVMQILGSLQALAIIFSLTRIRETLFIFSVLKSALMSEHLCFSGFCSKNRLLSCLLMP